MDLRFDIFSSGGEIELLLKRVRLGDSRAWEILVKKFESLVYSAALSTGVSRDEAADVFQQTFLALYKNLDRIEDTRSLPKWLSVTATREGIRLRRISSRESASENLKLLMEAEEAEAEKLAVDSVEAVGVREGLVKLGGKCETLLTMLYVDERSYQDVVAEANIPMGAIGPTRARCLEKLRKILEHDGIIFKDVLS